ncbi:trehalose transporter 1-like protein isoform X1 [Diabrotica undecimpunctata]|uniref:trehalose transporter 1-like protein isoform X1 n=1 Tax=Diabrotica undecimpunctata TaxID=50387 RepID=UPI003B635A47
MDNDKGNTPIHGKNVFQEVKYSQVNQATDEIKRPDTLFLYFTFMTVMLTAIVCGATIVWTSPAIVKLESNDTNINPLGRPIKSYELSKFMGIKGILSLVISLFLPKLADLIGRKMGIFWMAVIMYIGLIGLAFSKNVNVMTAFSVVSGACVNGLFSMIPMYLTEICEDHNRAKFLCLVGVFVPVGELCTFIIGPMFSYKIFTIIIAAPLIPFMVLSFLAPESPVYSLHNGRKEKCIQAIKKLRKNKTEAELEQDFFKIKKSLEDTDKSRGFNFRKLFGTKEGRLGIFIAFIPIFVQQISGFPTIMTLLAPIFNEFGSDISGDTVAIYVGVVKVILGIITAMIVERFGRRSLCLISAGGAGLPIFLLGIFFYLKYINSPLVYQYSWVPLVCILIYTLFISIGLGPIPMTLVNEMFSSDIRSIGCAFVLTLAFFNVTILISVYPIVAELIGTHWCMWTFGICCMIGTIIIHFVVPETKGKSVVEIQQILKNYKLL